MLVVLVARGGNCIFRGLFIWCTAGREIARSRKSLLKATLICGDKPCLKQERDLLSEQGTTSFSQTSAGDCSVIHGRHALLCVSAFSGESLCHLRRSSALSPAVNRATEPGSAYTYLLPPDHTWLHSVIELAEAILILGTDGKTTTVLVPVLFLSGPWRVRTCALKPAMFYSDQWGAE